MSSAAPARPMQLGGQFIAGADRPGSGPVVELRSPRDDRVVATLTGALGADVRAAYDAAASAQREWAATRPQQRARVFHDAVDLFRERTEELAALISAEMAKPLAEARAEVSKGVDVLSYFAVAEYGEQGSTYRTDTGDDVSVMREPLGVVALVTPWNFPFTLPLRKVAAALVTGNAALLKPAPGGVLIAHAIVDTLTRAGLPAGALNLVYGEVADIQDALFGDPRLCGVSFTGSWASADAIRSKVPVHVPLQAELGGKNALVVWRDAEINRAVEVVMASAFPNNGQICTSAGRVLVHEELAGQLLKALRSAMAEREVGDFGVLSSRVAQERIDTALAHDGGATEVVRAPWPDGLMAPTILVEPADDDVVREEIFGPVVTFETFADLDEALEKANGTRYGLTAGIVTRDLEVAHRFWTESTAGTVKVNAPLTGTPFHIALEGFGHSGVGAGEGGRSSLDFFTRKKTVYLRRG